MSDDIPTNNLHDLHDAWHRDNRWAGVQIVAAVVLWFAGICLGAFVLGCLVR